MRPKGLALLAFALITHVPRVSSSAESSVHLQAAIRRNSSGHWIVDVVLEHEENEKTMEWGTYDLAFKSLLRKNQPVLQTIISVTVPQVLPTDDEPCDEIGSNKTGLHRECEGQSRTDIVPALVSEPTSEVFTTTTSTTATTTTTTTTTTTASNTTTTTELPPDQCRLPLRPQYDPEASFDTHGSFFSRAENSRIQFNRLPGQLKNRYDFSLQFKTRSSEGVLFYVADIKHTDFVSLYMENGMLVHTYNSGTGPVSIISSKRFDDGKWHEVDFFRFFLGGGLIVDGQTEGYGQSPGVTKSINVGPPVHLGGVPQEIIEKVRLNVKVHDFGFEGCLKGLIENGIDFQEPILSSVRPCSFDFEKGVFFGEKGGFIKAKPVFRVGLTMKIQMVVKPRTMSGLLLYVHGKADFLLLQMVNGTVKLSVDNGGGPISSTYTPMNKNHLCDGQWHQILAVKYRNVVTLKIDSTELEPIIGRPGKTTTDTKSPLMIGGHSKPKLKLQGLEAKEHYVGCIKNIIINDKPVNLAKVRLGGDIMSTSCPLA